jgi:hypothetical protein
VISRYGHSRERLAIPYCSNGSARKLSFDDGITSKGLDHPAIVYPMVIALLFPMASAAMPSAEFG